MKPQPSKSDKTSEFNLEKLPKPGTSTLREGIVRFEWKFWLLVVLQSPRNARVIFVLDLLEVVTLCAPASCESIGVGFDVRSQQLLASTLGPHFVALTLLLGLPFPRALAVTTHLCLIQIHVSVRPRSLAPKTHRILVVGILREQPQYAKYARSQKCTVMSHNDPSPPMSSPIHDVVAQRWALLYPYFGYQRQTASLLFPPDAVTLRDPNVLEGNFFASPGACDICPKPHFKHGAIPGASFTVITSCPHHPDLPMYPDGPNKAVAKILPPSRKHATCIGDFSVPELLESVLEPVLRCTDSSTRPDPGDEPPSYQDSILALKSDFASSNHRKKAESTHHFLVQFILRLKSFSSSAFVLHRLFSSLYLFPGTARVLGPNKSLEASSLHVGPAAELPDAAVPPDKIPC
ncbi:hypothetical protein B0H12DRAFT_1080921 [Mycena haematopus]|nr:hypothetical protein B0H12DRAFT_1080921 [Mycena haematopus]